MAFASLWKRRTASSIAPVSEEEMISVPITLIASLDFASLLFGTKDFPHSDVPMQRIVDRVTDGTYKARPVKIFPFEHIPDAHRLMESNGANGKIVVVPALSATCAPLLAAAGVREETAAAMALATTQLPAMPPPAKRQRSGTSARGSHNSIRASVVPWSRCPPSGVPHASAATALGAELSGSPLPGCLPPPPTGYSPPGPARGVPPALDRASWSDASPTVRACNP